MRSFVILCLLHGLLWSPHLSSASGQDKLKPGRLPSDIRKSLQPGLLTEYFSSEGKLLDSMGCRLPAIFLKETEPVSPFVSERNVRIRMVGYLKLKLKGSYQFSAVGNGKLTLILNEQKALDVEGDLGESPAVSVDLVKGYNLMEIAYLPPKSGPSKFRLYWENESFEKEPIPPTVLFFSPQANATSVDNLEDTPGWSQHQSWHHGRDLILKHNCLKCHQAKGLDPLFKDQDTPDLKMVMGRLNRNWLKEWLLNPAGVRNDTSMPRLFSPEEKQEVADLVSFLKTLADDQEAKRQLANRSSGDAEQGGNDFENVGCIGCHHFERPDFEDEYERISLFFAKAKFKPGGLADFLSDSRAHYRWSRMPKFKLTTKQVADLEAFIRSESKGITESLASKKRDPSNGAILFKDRGCANCHAGVIQGDEAESLFTEFNQLQSTDGCLNANKAKNDPAIPDFGLNETETESLSSLISRQDQMVFQLSTSLHLPRVRSNQ